MCHRISPLLIQELREALGELGETGRARVPRRDPHVVVPDAYPGKQLPLFVPGEDGALEAVELRWGFDQPGGGSRLVFNTRIETALDQARSGRGLWADPVRRGRCLVPVRAFYEHWTVKPPHRGTQVRFRYPGHRIFLLAGVRDDRCVSVVTTAPNASVASVHTRMPLVLAPGESRIWLGDEFATLADRAAIPLDATVEEP